MGLLLQLPGKPCTSRYRCHKCKGKHHTSLCSGKHSPRGTATAPIALTVPNNTPQDTSKPSISSVHATLSPITDPTPAASFLISGGQISLLKTAISIANTEHIYCEANFVLYEGAKHSFITHALANQLVVPLLKSGSNSLSAFGVHTSAGRQLPVAVINVVTIHGEKIPLRVLAVDMIATPLKTNFCHQI